MISLDVKEKLAQIFLMVTVIIMVFALSGIADASSYQHLSNVLPASLSSIQGQQIFNSLY